MRMWMINPAWLCDKHLLGEHFEIHKHRHNFVKQHSMSGRIKPITHIEPLEMQRRHDALEDEARRRGFNCNSPYTMPDVSYLPKDEQLARVNHTESIRTLRERCPACRARIDQELPFNFDADAPLIRRTRENIREINNVVYIQSISIKNVLKDGTV